MFESYLHNRKQRVSLNGFNSDYSEIESGVPQGSVLGPLLFLVYINDLEKNLKSNVKFFADDTMLYSIVVDPSTSASDLNHDLELISQWAFRWKMAFNPDPNKQATEVLFSCKKKPVQHPELIFNGAPVSRVSEHKHLGLTVQPSLSFAKHINEKIKKAKKNIGIIKHLNSVLPFLSLKQMYIALVRSHLEYCDIIFHIPPKIHPPPLGMSLHDHMEKIEKVQYQAGLAVTGAWQGTSRIKLYEQLGWESLSDRRICRRVLQIHKIVDEKTPKYLQDCLPPNRNVIINLPLIFQEFRSRTDRYSGSFFPNAVSLWNNFITNFQNLPTFLSLKAHLVSLFRPPPKPIYGIHDPVTLRNLFQLRLGLSKLRHHKKRHNFLDTPSDHCLCKTGIEDCDHFFLVCPFYNSHRTVLRTNVNGILFKNGINIVVTSEIYLYGHESLSDNDNHDLLLASLEFIVKSNRFAN